MSLADDMARELAGTGHPMTAEQLARAMRRRTIDVQRALKEDSRFVPWPHERKSLYGVTVLGEGRERAGEETGRPLEEPDVDDAGEKTRARQEARTAGASGSSSDLRGVH